MDMDINILFATSSPHVSMPTYVRLDPDATRAIA